MWNKKKKIFEIKKKQFKYKNKMVKMHKTKKYKPHKFVKPTKISVNK